jgi:hypothetical protein
VKLVKVDAVVVLAARETAAARVLAVLAWDGKRGEKG